MSKTTTLPALYGSDQEALEAMQPRLRHVRALQQQYAATIIAGGIFNDMTDGWSGIVAALAEADARAETAALTDLFKRLEHASPDSTRIPNAIPGEPEHEDLAEDVLTVVASRWGDAGFLLGLAVGMQLGPHAFDGGDR